MSGFALVTGLALLAVCLGAAVARPRGISEALVGVPCALLALLVGVTDLPTARHSVAAWLRPWRSWPRSWPSAGCAPTPGCSATWAA